MFVTEWVHICIETCQAELCRKTICYIFLANDSDKAGISPSKAIFGVPWCKYFSTPKTWELMSTDHNQTIAPSHQSFRWKAVAKSPLLKVIALDISGLCWTLQNFLRCAASPAPPWLSSKCAMRCWACAQDWSWTNLSSSKPLSTRKEFSVISLSFYHILSLYRYGQPCGQVCPMPFALVSLKVSVPTTTFLTHILPPMEHNHERRHELGMWRMWTSSSETTSKNHNI